MKLNSATLLVVGLTALAGLLISCSNNHPVGPLSQPDNGMIEFALSTTGSPEENIASGLVTINKGALAQSENVVIEDHAGTVRFSNIQVGEWAIVVQLFDSAGVEIYSGTGTAVVNKDQNTTVSIKVIGNTGNLKITVDLPQSEDLVIYCIGSGSDIMVNTSDLYGNIIESFTVNSVADQLSPTYDYISNARGGNQLIVTSGPAAFYISLVNFDGTNRFQFPLTPGGGEARWSWNGDWIAGTNTYIDQISVFSADGSSRIDLTKTNTDGKDYRPCWTPDGRILYNHSGPDSTTSVYIMNRDGSGRQQITNPVDNIIVTDCSADYTLLININYERYIGRLQLDGSGLKKIIEGSNGYFNSSGSKIVYKKFEPEQSIWIINSDGSGNRQLFMTNDGYIGNYPTFRY